MGNLKLRLREPSDFKLLNYSIAQLPNLENAFAASHLHTGVGDQFALILFILLTSMSLHCLAGAQGRGTHAEPPGTHGSSRLARWKNQPRISSCSKKILLRRTYTTIVSAAPLIAVDLRFDIIAVILFGNSFTAFGYTIPLQITDVHWIAARFWHHFGRR